MRLTFVFIRFRAAVDNLLRKMDALTTPSQKHRFEKSYSLLFTPLFFSLFVFSSCLDGIYVD